ncbi:YafY family protein [Tabrizicola sp.]|uniref:helix-turn-helix transcriptional regulator n=1 Tax=Tabrizicola sp. TaxID=2005166 RepID=UPI0027331E4F|nr:WYL domain-containing protein [Tabrizicola sp.]MDP3196998.1 WYL domain-containing protein [Tabrizicola sp.]
MRLFRLLSLLDALRLRHGPVTARQIAADCGISLRTAYRDIADLQAMGAPIRGEGGVGYVLEPGYFLPPLGLDEEELEALALGAGLVAGCGDAALGAAAQRALAKVAGATRSERRAVLIDPILDAAPPAPALAVTDLAPIRRAIRERRMTEIDYLSLSGQASHRRARPLGLTVFNHAWLLTIWCETAQDFRHLRADLISRFHPLPDRFRPESGKRLADCHRREGRRPETAPPQPEKRC